MARRTLLTPDQLSDALAELSGWAGDVQGVHRRMTGIDFRTAAGHVAALADIADALDHHPEVEIGSGSLIVHLITHSADGVTELDVEFAHRFDAHLDDRTDEAAWR